MELCVYWTLDAQVQDVAPALNGQTSLGNIELNKVKQGSLLQGFVRAFNMTVFIVNV